MQVYIGRWAGRRWFFPTIFYQNSLRHGTPGWHIPEQAWSFTLLWTKLQRLISGFAFSNLAELRGTVQMPKQVLSIWPCWQELHNG